MNYFRHDFDSIEGYLHHRAPYLLVKEIIEIGSRGIRAKSVFDGSEFFFQGHFPGAPVLPGALMQEITTQTAGILIASRFNPMAEYNTEDPFFNDYALGVLVKVLGARYRGFARPDDELRIHVQLQEKVGELFDFTGRIHVGEKLIMKNEFQLTNIKSSVLQGTDK